MKHRLAGMIVAGMAVAATCAVSFAGPNANAKIVLHLRMVDKCACPCFGTRPPCYGIITHGDLYPPYIGYAHLLVVDGNKEAGVAGVQFGIEYGSGMADGVGIDIWSWVLCATLEFRQPSPAWPESGGGNMVTWDPVNQCQRYLPAGNDPDNGVVAYAGWFYMAAYTPADLRITPRPVDGMAKVASCAAVEDNIEGVGLVRTPSHLGWCGFGTEPGNLHAGYNPCGLNTPIEETTWSSVKSLYGRR